jgi:hypothetical protein
MCCWPAIHSGSPGTFLQDNRAIFDARHAAQSGINNLPLASVVVFDQPAEHGLLNIVAMKII